MGIFTCINQMRVRWANELENVFVGEMGEENHCQNEHKNKNQNHIQEKKKLKTHENPKREREIPAHVSWLREMVVLEMRV